MLKTRHSTYQRLIFGIVFSLCIHCGIRASCEGQTASIANIEYPQHVTEAEPFDLTVFVRNFSNKTETFLVRIVRSNYFSVQKKIAVPRNGTKGVSFVTRLLLSGTLRIELIHGNLLADTSVIYVEIPTPEADVGLLMINLVNANVTVIGVMLAALAIFSTVYSQSRHHWQTEKADSTQNLVRLREKLDSNERNMLECAIFLLKEEYEDSFGHFAGIESVRTLLSEATDVDGLRAIRKELGKISKMIKSFGGIFGLAVAYGLIYMIAAPTLVDILLFVYPVLGARDIFLFSYFFPLYTLLVYCILRVLRSYVESKMIVHAAEIMIYAGIVVLTVMMWETIRIEEFVFGCLLGIVIAVAPRIEKWRGELFSRELSRAKTLKERLRKLEEKDGEDGEEFRSEIIEELNRFGLAFELIREDLLSKLQRAERERSLGLISDKSYQRRRKKLDSTMTCVNEVVSEAQVNNALRHR